jgi:hypothetical protein
VPTNLSVDSLVELGVERQHAIDWFVVRKNKGAPQLTATSWKKLVAEAEKAGVTPARAVELAAENEWRGFVASWLIEKGGRAGGVVGKQAAIEANNKAVGDSWLAGMEGGDATE